jgi:4-hydroxy 2-oxovalerate aldolase
MMEKLHIQDVTLRDGMHAVRYGYSLADVSRIARALDRAGVAAIEVGHGDGLSGSSFTYGVGRHTDRLWIETAAAAIETARLGTFLIPGIGTIDDLKEAAAAGVRAVRIAVHCTEANVAARHIGAARNLGLDVAGCLMMAHLNTPAGLAEQARLIESYGAHCVTIADSAGALTVPAAVERVRAVRQALKPGAEVGIHVHNNPSLSVAISLAAVEHGASRVVASLAGTGAGAGSAPIEAFVAAADRMGLKHGCDLNALVDAAEDLVRPLLNRPARVDRETLSIGCAGLHPSFLRPAEIAAAHFKVEVRSILAELAHRQVIGGQGDMIVDVALDLAARRATTGASHADA